MNTSLQNPFWFPLPTIHIHWSPLREKSWTWTPRNWELDNQGILLHETLVKVSHLHKTHALPRVEPKDRKLAPSCGKLSVLFPVYVQIIHGRVQLQETQIRGRGHIKNPDLKMIGYTSPRDIDFHLRRSSYFLHLCNLWNIPNIYLAC